jgi:hypothetical protein
MKVVGFSGAFISFFINRIIIFMALSYVILGWLRHKHIITYTMDGGDYSGSIEI